MKLICFVSIFLLTMLLLFSFRTRQKSCEQIKNGKFYYFSKETRERVNVVRLDSVQVEKTEKPGDKPLKNKISWKADCEFDLYVNALSDEKLTGIDSLIAATPAHVRIIYVGTSYYVCTGHMKIFGKEINLRDTLYYSEPLQSTQ